MATPPFIDPLLGLPRLLSSAIADLRTIAAATAVLPVVAERLASIDKGVASLDEEVRQMRAAVDRIRVDVTGVRQSVKPLAGKLDGVNDALADELDDVQTAINRLEPYLEEVRRSVGPLGQLAGRIPGGGRRRNGE